jgi:hypothetical protein
MEQTIHYIICTKRNIGFQESNEALLALTILFWQLFLKRTIYITKILYTCNTFINNLVSFDNQIQLLQKGHTVPFI